MANEKKLVEAITSMDEDFAQWYTDVVKKAELTDYSSVRGCMNFTTGRLCHLGKYTEGTRQKIQGNRRRKCIYAIVHS